MMERATVTDRFSILKEAAAGSRAGKAWAEENPTHPRIFSVAEFAARGRRARAWVAAGVPAVERDRSSSFQVAGCCPPD